MKRKHDDQSDSDDLPIKKQAPLSTSSSSTEQEKKKKKRKRKSHKHKKRHRHKKRQRSREESSEEIDYDSLTKFNVYDVTWKMLEKNIYAFKFPVTMKHGNEAIIMCCKAVEEYCEKYKINYTVDDHNPPSYHFEVKSNDSYHEVKQPNITPFTTPELAHVLVTKYLSECFRNDTFFEFPVARDVVTNETLNASINSVVSYCEDSGIGCEVNVDTEPVSFTFKIPDDVKKRILEESIKDREKERERAAKRKANAKKEKKRQRKLAKLALDYDPL